MFRLPLGNWEVGWWSLLVEKQCSRFCPHAPICKNKMDYLLFFLKNGIILVFDSIWISMDTCSANTVFLWYWAMWFSLCDFFLSILWQWFFPSWYSTVFADAKIIYLSGYWETVVGASFQIFHKDLAPSVCMWDHSASSVSVKCYCNMLCYWAAALPFLNYTYLCILNWFDLNLDIKSKIWAHQLQGWLVSPSVRQPIAQAVHWNANLLYIFSKQLIPHRGMWV